MYHSDKPIEQFEDDLLGRASFARQLADSILSIDLTDCFAISICGKWGTGKTSVLNMMQKEIEAKALKPFMLKHFLYAFSFLRRVP